MKIKQTARKASQRLFYMAVSAGISLVVLVAAGAAYIYFTGGNTERQVQVPKPDVVANSPVKPPKESPDAPASAVIEEISSPVKPGAEASVSVQTNVKAKCSIQVAYAESGVTKLYSDAAGLEPKIADDFGSVSWSWKTKGLTNLNKRTVVITCSYHKKTAVVQGEVDVQP